MLCPCRIPTKADVAFCANINGREGSLCFLVEVAARPTTVSLSELQPVGFDVLQ